MTLTLVNASDTLMAHEVVRLRDGVSPEEGVRARCPTRCGRGARGGASRTPQAPHTLFIARLLPGRTFDDVRGWLAAPGGAVR